jgi:hypothetical protein
MHCNLATIPGVLTQKSSQQMKKHAIRLRNPFRSLSLDMLGEQVLLQNFSGDLTMNKFQRYRLSCTLSFGDIYGQIIIWLLVIFASLAAAMGLMGASRPIYALATVGLILVLSLPFLLFAFVTTLLNHIEVMEIDPVTQSRPATNIASQQRPAAI